MLAKLRNDVACFMICCGRFVIYRRLTGGFLAWPLSGGVIERILEAPRATAGLAAPAGVPIATGPVRAPRDSASPASPLTGARLEEAIERLGKSGSSPHIRAVTQGMHSLGYEFVPARSTRGGAPENYLRAIDSRRGITAVAILTPTYLEFTPFALRLVPDLASLADGQRRESGMKFPMSRASCQPWPQPGCTWNKDPEPGNCLDQPLNAGGG